MPKQRVLDVAQKNFGFDSLRPGQEEAIGALLKGKDTLVVMPTVRANQQFTRSQVCC
ncbi:MAG: hypothetical protein M3Y57_04540 [Acidobacteriota bacterium]|nr:hypothetical protein [Acidobacteriota bacterium]